ncbi:VC_2705 family sodium/solute symporter [Roseateles oligotrophus]|uniref:VC_2705 family sodium/solute symporter n=1 Tax=Roseateles oligotrophus TaxID=1769250 RepID=A0ABT2Y9T2_9BURK|nr:VC_2705 family sodium/solute symporter [Roseateles oligotrophus]MCV2366810.1 VC_2705 family sodium/solute symporter [Roseateles oligotrophus]
MTSPQADALKRRTDTGSSADLSPKLRRIYAWYTLGFVLFVLVLAVLEQWGLAKSWIGFSFMAATVGIYACIGLLSRTTDADEYYVAGRRVPAIFNGMAAGADWMSAASFIGLAGTLYLSGYGGLAFVLGWTGGFVLVALCLAPYLRKFGQFTIPDFLGARYGGTAPRLIGAAAAILVSFIYVVAQIYGVGLITSRLTGLAFEVGVFVGLGGVLVCSFLGGMRAVTWTQVAQYIVLVIAYLVPVIWLSAKQTGLPLPQVAYGYQLAKLSEREQQLLVDPAELQVRAVFQARADGFEHKLQNVPASLAQERAQAAQRVADLKRQEDTPLALVQAAEKSQAALPRTPAEAREQWQRAQTTNEARAQPLAGMPPHAQQFAGDPNGTPQERLQFDESRRNFMALVFCLMVGTAGLPHILTRYYTTPSVREARESVAWSLFFIALLYLTAPALAVMVKYEVFTGLVGTPIASLPSWIAQWTRVDAGLLSVSDVNGDGILQLGELRISSDIIMLMTPELAGLPYVVSGMVAAGGLAAALSTADGLLLTISSALSHDVYFRVLNPTASMTRRVTLSKALLLATALAAAAVAAHRPADILYLVAAAFSVAGAAFFPALVLGIFWRRANGWGAVAGMLVGLGLTCYYMIHAMPGLRAALGVPGPAQLWWGIQPISAGLFGVPAGFATMLLVSYLTPAPSPAQLHMLDQMRTPAATDGR